MDIGSIEGVSQEYPPHTASNRGDPCHPSFATDVKQSLIRHILLLGMIATEFLIPPRADEHV